MSNNSTRITGQQIRAARGLLRLTAAQLATMAKVGAATVRRAELEDGPVVMHVVTEEAVRSALERAGVRFIDAVEGITGPGVAMKWGVKLPQRFPDTVEGENIPDGTELKNQGLADYFAERPHEWTALSEISKQAILMEVYGPAPDFTSH